MTLIPTHSYTMVLTEPLTHTHRVVMTLTPTHSYTVVLTEPPTYTHRVIMTLIPAHSYTVVLTQGYCIIYNFLVFEPVFLAMKYFLGGLYLNSQTFLPS